ncbi:MAG: hypothetical protein LBC99_03170 [Spirochaetota bacterium]|nr:hypothetical protein [Spirochaetota bacterium]
MERLVTVVPGLISLSVNIARLRDFLFLEDFSFFPATSAPLPFHYTIEKISRAACPQEWEYRLGYHTCAHKRYTYYRPLLRTGLFLQYDEAQRHFSVNSMYLKIPFRIGGIRSVGEHIFARIAFDLFQAGFMLFRGCAWLDAGGKVHTLVLPAMNGKTTLLRDLMASGRGNRYIAEDLVLLKPQASGYMIYPTAAFRRNYGRRVNAQLARLIIPDSCVSEPLAGEYITFASTYTHLSPSVRQEAIDYGLMTSLFFLQDPEVQLGLFAEAKTKVFFDNVYAGFNALQPCIRSCSIEAVKDLI